MVNFQGNLPVKSEIIYNLALYFYPLLIRLHATYQQNGNCRGNNLTNCSAGDIERHLLGF